MSWRRLIKLALKVYSLGVVSSIFALVLYNWILQLNCLNCVFDIWEPNPVIHLYELAMMILALPGICVFAWECDQ